jgi:hypothetical protein
VTIATSELLAASSGVCRSDLGNAGQRTFGFGGSLVGGRVRDISKLVPIDPVIRADRDVGPAFEKARQ